MRKTFICLAFCRRLSIALPMAPATRKFPAPLEQPSPAFAAIKANGRRGPSVRRGRRAGAMPGHRTRAQPSATPIGGASSGFGWGVSVSGEAGHLLDAPCGASLRPPRDRLSKWPQRRRKHERKKAFALLLLGSCLLGGRLARGGLLCGGGLLGRRLLGSGLAGTRLGQCHSPLDASPNRLTQCILVLLTG